MITIEEFRKMIPLASAKNIGLFYEPLCEAMLKYEITSSKRIAAFIAQIAHESGNLDKLIESTYYSKAERLLKLFPRDFKDLAEAEKYIKSPEACANRIYANQNGNGSEKSGDGYRYRARGLIGITGKGNYASCGTGLGLDLVNHPELLEQPKYACESAAWFWATHGCNKKADLGLFLDITRIINGGTNGLEERKANYKLCKQILNLI